MADEIRRLIRVRNQKGATFKRDGFGKKKQLSSSWRKPRGQHNKQREQKKAKGNLPKPGFGSPIGVRGMHPSGFFDVLVHTADDLAGLDPKTQAIRIAATVGSRKRAAIQQAALSAGLRVLNARAAQPVKKPEPAKEAEEKPQEQKKKKAAAPKAKPVAEKAPEQPEAKKESKKAPKEPAPKKVKESKNTKPAETTGPAQAAEEPKKKEQKPKAKAKAVTDAKPKKAAASKAEPGKEAKPAKKATAKPKKKTSTGVNNNE
jgi:large subunit ribosomal protein L32e